VQWNDYTPFNPTIAESTTNSYLSIQVNQPTRCKNFSSLLLDVCLQLNMFPASSRQLSGAQQLQ